MTQPDLDTVEDELLNNMEADTDEQGNATDQGKTNNERRPNN